MDKVFVFNRDVRQETYVSRVQRIASGHNGQQAIGLGLVDKDLRLRGNRWMQNVQVPVQIDVGNFEKILRRNAVAILILERDARFNDLCRFTDFAAFKHDVTRAVGISWTSAANR